MFEIWDRTTKKVYWHVIGMHTVLDEKDDPLKLETFFPCPPPLIANPTTSNLMPRADYKLAQDQYDQIDELTTRITYLTRAAKVIGAYDSKSPRAWTHLQGGHGERHDPGPQLGPVLARRAASRGSMDFVPIDMVAKTIADLTQQRDILIAKLYEVLGIGDIMRGMSNPDETLGAQQLKAQFGGSRLQFKQMEIGEWVAAGQRIRAADHLLPLPARDDHRALATSTTRTTSRWRSRPCDAQAGRDQALPHHGRVRDDGAGGLGAGARCAGAVHGSRGRVRAGCHASAAGQPRGHSRWCCR